jgi:hypothetical protein
LRHRPALRTHPPRRKPGPVVVALRAAAHACAAASEGVETPGHGRTEEGTGNKRPSGDTEGPCPRVGVPDVTTPDKRLWVSFAEPPASPVQAVAEGWFGFVASGQLSPSETQGIVTLRIFPGDVPPNAEYADRHKQHRRRRAAPLHRLPDLRVRLHPNSVPHSRSPFPSVPSVSALRALCGPALAVQSTPLADESVGIPGRNFAWGGNLWAAGAERSVFGTGARR